MANPSTDKSEEVMRLNNQECEALIFPLFGYLCTHTRHEAKGNLRQDGVEQNNILRGLLMKLLIKYNKKLSEAEALSAGLVDLVSKSYLQEIANDKESGGREFQSIARYFLGKKKL